MVLSELHEAASAGNAPLARQLLDANANLEERDEVRPRVRRPGRRREEARPRAL